MNWTLPRAKETALSTCWRADEIIVVQGRQLIDRLRAGDIDRVTLVHTGEGESPVEVRAAIFELAGRAVLLGAASGIAGRVLFEHQAYWSQRNCIYWVNERRVSWPATRGESRWPFGKPRLPPHRPLALADVATLLERADATGPHTWDQRKRHRIERRRPFPGHAIVAPALHGSMLT
jgi:hypothetical protein